MIRLCPPPHLLLCAFFIASTGGSGSGQEPEGPPPTQEAEPSGIAVEQVTEPDLPFTQEEAEKRDYITLSGGGVYIHP